MCTKDKCMFCIQLETGCLIYGIFMCIVSGLGILGLIGGLIYINLIKDDIIPNDFYHNAAAALDEDYANRRAIAQAAYIGLNIGMGVGLVSMIIQFAFHVVLCDGANKRNAGKVKVYFIYGVTIQVLSLISLVILFASTGDISIVLLALFSNVLYGLIMWMVFNTYKKLTVNSGYVYSQYQDSTQLVNTNNSPY